MYIFDSSTTSIDLHTGANEFQTIVINAPKGQVTAMLEAMALVAGAGFKVTAIKTLRATYTLTLKEAKYLVDAAMEHWGAAGPV